VGVRDRLVLPGYQTDPWPFYASADLFVLSSDQEGFGNVLIEAMCAGLPVVSTDCPTGPREILGEAGEFGSLVACGDVDGLAVAMERALAAPRDAPGAAAARAEHLSGHHVTDAYLELLLGSAASEPKPLHG
jgi:glycosyltransferase involved in cell wall biosynthesis